MVTKAFHSVIKLSDIFMTSPIFITHLQGSHGGQCRNHGHHNVMLKAKQRAVRQAVTERKLQSVYFQSSEHLFSG